MVFYTLLLHFLYCIHLIPPLPLSLSASPYSSLTHHLSFGTALKPSDVIKFFKEVADQANEIQDAYNKCKEPISKLSIPSVTVFLDEVNTASCLGLFKEIIVDKTIDGVVSKYVELVSFCFLSITFVIIIIIIL